VAVAIDSEGEITRLLAAWREGCARAGEELFDRFYTQLRRVASQRRARAPGELSLGVTEIVAEIYLRLAGQRARAYRNRQHFLAISSHLARQVLIDHARRKSRDKRGGGAISIPLPDAPCDSSALALDADELLALHDALLRLQEISELSAKIVELRFFGGLNVDQTAAVLGVGRATVVRDWRWARAWLHRQLHHGSQGHEDENP
jgi:RNA polymerase sigma factor (TIGR02999 family)